jgi:hypothetical protein
MPVAGFVVTAAVLSALGVANAASADRYLHDPAAPPLCAFPWTTPDPSVSVCQARFFAPRLALTSQSVLLRIGDAESSRADCVSYDSGVATTFAIDGQGVSITKIPCHDEPRVNVAGVMPVWGVDYRHFIPAGTIAPGVHTVTWTSTYTRDVSYSLGCTDPSGRCTVSGGTVVSSTTQLIIQ